MDTNRLKHAVRQEEGSTAVLVILMMIVLVSLGYFAIASANSNIKLSNNAQDWSKKYYHLDGEAEVFTAHVDELLLNAQLLTNEYFETQQYLELTHPELPLEMHMVITGGYEDAWDKDFFIEQSLDTIFFFYADKELEKLSLTYPSAVVSCLRDGDYVLGIICNVTLDHEESLEYHLNVSLSVNGYSSYKYDHINGNTATKRYKVTEWNQWQNQPIDEETKQFWDGTITLP